MNKMEIITYPQEVAKDVLKVLELEDYSPESLIELEQFLKSIHEERPIVEPDRIHLYTCLSGCFLGECIIAKIGGKWVHDEHGFLLVECENCQINPLRRAGLYISGEDDTTLFQMYIGVVDFVINCMHNHKPTIINS